MYSTAIKTLKQDFILSQVIEQIGECRLNQVQQTGDLLSCLSRAIIYQHLTGDKAAKQLVS
jgi:DNA-3-methyladenine glycosylase II